jgi:carboxypeptidase C (cathepsin A)
MSNNLERALRENPKLKVLIMAGHTDLATPPSNIEFSINHLSEIPDSRRQSIQFAWFEAGHMFYLNEPDLIKMRKDLVNFLK